MAKSKATKKFEQRHLQDSLKRRKDSKSKQKLHAKSKTRTDPYYDKPEERNDGEDGSTSAGAKFADMTVDDFFQGGFEVPEAPRKKRKRGGATEKATIKKTKVKQNSDDEDLAAEDSSDEANGAGGMIEDQDDDLNSDSGDDEETHKQDLDQLAQNDPEFYKYLQDNDAELLDFEQGNFDEIDQLSDEAKPRKKKTMDKDLDSDDDASGIMSLATIDRWERAMTQLKSLRSTREVILAFRSAAHMNDTSGKDYKYTITNSDVYNKLVVSALQFVPETLNHHLPIKELSTGKIQFSAESKKFRTMAPMIKSHMASLLHLLSNLSDSKTLRLTLSSVLSLVPYTLSFRKIVKEIGKGTADIWSDPASDEATRISAFLILRKLIVIGDAGIRASVLKTTYQALIKGCRNTTVHTIKSINLMKNSAAELWGIDSSVGYTTGFGFIRQLAIHLRSTITNKTKDSYKVVYNWQCVHSLDFWSRVLAQNCSSLREAEMGNESPLRALIYPAVQVTLGVMRLIPTSQYFPLRFQLFRSLLRISLATNTFIPLAPALYEVLTSREMKRAPKPTTVKSLDFSTSIRAAKSLLGTRVYQDGVGEQVVELFSEFFILWCKSIAFPELVLPVIVMLKRWLKDATNKNTGNKNTKCNSALHILVQKLEANSSWIEQKRAKVDFAPNNRSGAEHFLKEIEWNDTPLGAYVKVQRKLREEKEKLLDHGRNQGSSRHDVRKGKIEKAEVVGTGDSEDEDASEEESD